MKDPYTGGYLNAVDRKLDSNRNVVIQPEERRVYVTPGGEPC